MSNSAESASLSVTPTPSASVAPTTIGEDRVEGLKSPELPTPSMSQSQVATLVESVPTPPIPEQEQVPAEGVPTPAPTQDEPTPIHPSLATGSSTNGSTNESPVPSNDQKNEKQAPTPQPIPQTPQIYLTFLLLSGHRRTMNFEPGTGIGRVKEVVWGGWSGGDWPAEDRPPAPSYLRVLHAGRMLQDDETLINLKLPIYTPPTQALQESTPQPQPPTTIMHISVRPFGHGVDDIESASVKKSGGRRGRGRRDGTSTSEDGAIEEPRTVCCGCVIC